MFFTMIVFHKDYFFVANISSIPSGIIIFQRILRKSWIWEKRLEKRKKPLTQNLLKRPPD